MMYIQGHSRISCVLPGWCISRTFWIIFLELSSTALSRLVGEAASLPMVILMCPSWLYLTLWFLFFWGMYSDTLVVLSFCLLSSFQYVQYLKGSAPFLRVPLARCFARAVLVFSRVSDSFKHIHIQQLRCFSWVFYSGLDSTLNLLGVGGCSWEPPPFLEGIRNSWVYNSVIHTVSPFWPGVQFSFKLHVLGFC